MTLGQDTNDTRLNLKDAVGLNKDETLEEGRRRLDEIAKEGFRSIDACIYDRWTPPRDSWPSKNVLPARQYYMPGALVTEPSHLYHNSLTADTTQDAQNIPNNTYFQTTEVGRVAQVPGFIIGDSES